MATSASTGSLVAALTFDAYGAPVDLIGASSIRFGYAGQYTDPESGLVYMRARMYDPQTGQFTSRDPLVGLTEQPYAYVGGDPINAVDPNGDVPLAPALPGIGGSIAGGLAGAGALAGPEVWLLAGLGYLMLQDAHNAPCDTVTTTIPQLGNGGVDWAKGGKSAGKGRGSGKGDDPAYHQNADDVKSEMEAAKAAGDSATAQRLRRILKERGEIQRRKDRGSGR